MIEVAGSFLIQLTKYKLYPVGSLSLKFHNFLLLMFLGYEFILNLIWCNV